MQDTERVKSIIRHVKSPHVYFIGIAGKGLNGMARYCLQKGWKVSGSDLSLNKEVIGIRRLGGKIFHFHASENITDEISILVYSSIIKNNNPEIVRARKMSIPVVKRAEFLEAVLGEYNIRISIAGSHGKSTTTALCGLALLGSDADPTIFNGAYIKELNAGERMGSGRYALAEACEYDESFMHLIADISVITAIEKSHMEYYKTEEHMLAAFRRFIYAHGRDAVIIANGDVAQIRSCLLSARATVETFGFQEDNSYVIKNVRYGTHGSAFDLYYHGACIMKNLFILIPGDYNIYNFAAAAVLLHVLDLPISAIYNIGRTFQGVGRRFEVSPIKDDFIFIDDFCHHPTQVKNLFSGIHQFFPEKKVCAVFQPRQYHLMKTFLKEYGESFKGADRVIVTDILPALGDTEADKQSLKSADIIDSIKKYSNKNEVSYRPSLSDAVQSIKQFINKDWIVATIGAGDVYKIKDMYAHS